MFISDENFKTRFAFYFPAANFCHPDFKKGNAKEVKTYLYLLVVLLHLVKSKAFSRPASFIADVARDDNSFKMISFYVILYVWTVTFFSTDFAKISKTFSISSFVLALLHH